jgi:hypothetical protein
MTSKFDRQPAFIIDDSENTTEKFVVILSRKTLKAIDVVSTDDEFWSDEDLRNRTFGHLYVVHQYTSPEGWAYWESVHRLMKTQALRTVDAVALVDKAKDKTGN